MSWEDVACSLRRRCFLTNEVILSRGHTSHRWGFHTDPDAAKLDRLCWVLCTPMDFSLRTETLHGGHGQISLL